MLLNKQLPEDKIEIFQMTMSATGLYGCIQPSLSLSFSLFLFDATNDSISEEIWQAEVDTFVGHLE